MTNQSGIGLGYYSVEDFYKVSSALLGKMSEAGILVDKIYFCPHSLAEKCNCRKPGTGLLELAREQLNIDIGNSVFIGDRSVDIETARRADCLSILVRTGKGGEDGEYQVTPDLIADDLDDAARLVLERERRG